MKNIIKTIGLITLIGFSFFYTDKVIEVIREEDKIMIELESTKDFYKTEPINATIIGNTIIPGVSGKQVNIDKSYNKMKSNGLYNKNFLIYDSITPDISLKNNNNKFIISGNTEKQMISIIFILNNNKYLSQIEEIITTKEVTANYFVPYNYLTTYSTKIKEMTNREFYSYGDNGKYTPDNLLFSNNLISRISNNNAIYCLALNMEEEILNLCKENNLYTITPNIIGKNNPYNNIKTNLNSGSIILLSMNKETIKELPTSIEYIKGKGLNIVGLSTLLSEELEEE